MLNLKQGFLISKIARKLKLKDAKIDFSKSEEEVGGELLFYILENLDQAEDEIITLLSEIMEVKKEILETTDIFEIFENLKKNEKLKNFFSNMRGLMTSMQSMSLCNDTEDKGLSFC